MAMCIRANSKIIKLMAMVYLLTKMVTDIWGIGRMIKSMGKEEKFGLMMIRNTMGITLME